MGKGRRYRVATRAVLAFGASPAWGEAELAQQLGVSVRSTRRVLERLRAQGMPLLLRGCSQRRRWFVPSAWGETLGATGGEETAALLEALWELPPTPRRDGLLTRLLDGGVESPSYHLPSAWLSSMDGSNRELQQFLLEAAMREYPVRVRCFSGRGPVFADRPLSIQRVLVGEKTAFLALCHQSGVLGWYASEDVVSAVKLRDELYRRASRKEVATLLEQGPPLKLHARLAFRVRYPEARWVQRAVLPGMQIDEVNSDDQSLRVIAAQCGAVAVARFVASLGGAARAEGAALAGLVTGIAAATLSVHRLSDEAFGRNRAVRTAATTKGAVGDDTQRGEAPPVSGAVPRLCGVQMDGPPAEEAATSQGSPGVKPGVTKASSERTAAAIPRSGRVRRSS